MVLQVSYILVASIGIFIVLCLILLVIVSPKAAKDYKQFAQRKTVRRFDPGEGLTALLEKLATCDRERKVRELIGKISVEAQRTSSTLKNETADHARTVLRWLEYFDVERHLGDLKKSKESSQIRYDEVHKDFKLLIPSQDED